MKTAKPNKLKKALAAFVCLGLAAIIILSIVYPMYSKNFKTPSYASSLPEIITYPQLGYEFPRNKSYLVYTNSFGDPVRYEDFRDECHMVPIAYFLIQDITQKQYILKTVFVSQSSPYYPSGSDIFKSTIINDNQFQLRPLANFSSNLYFTNSIVSVNGPTFVFTISALSNFYPLPASGGTIYDLLFWRPSVSSPFPSNYVIPILAGTRDISYDASYNIYNGNVERFYSFFANPQDIYLWDYTFTPPPTEPPSTEPPTVTTNTQPPIGTGTGPGGGGGDCNGCCNVNVNVNNNQQVEVNITNNVGWFGSNVPGTSDNTNNNQTVTTPINIEELSHDIDSLDTSFIETNLLSPVGALFYALQTLIFSKSILIGFISFILIFSLFAFLLGR